MYRPTPEDFDDINVPTNCAVACSAEPFKRADHKAKSHSRPRRNEMIGGGHFVFRRGGRTGRIKTGSIMAGKMPFEHPSMESARTEAERLQALYGGRYDVLSVSSIVDGTSEHGEWDCGPVADGEQLDEVA